MKSESEIRSYLMANGIPFTEPIYGGKTKLRVMDVTQLPGVMREQFDERGFFLAAESEPSSKGKSK